MNEYLFFTLEGETIAPNNSFDVENCQLLGRVCATSADKARELLLSENPWIDNAGFTSEGIIQEQIATSEQLSCIREVVAYLRNEVSVAHEKGHQQSDLNTTWLDVLDEMAASSWASIWKKSSSR